MSSGYGRRHHELRLRLLPKAYGTPCVRCGRTMEHGQDLDLDHTDDRAGYRGFAHAFCNRSAGGYKGTGGAPYDPQPSAATQW
jgi:hypothetical protein